MVSYLVVINLKKLDPCSYQTNKTQLRVGAKGNFIASSEQHAGGCT